MMTLILLIRTILIMISHLPSSVSMQLKHQLRFSSRPYLTRHLSTCEDTDEPFEVLFPTRVRRTRDCLWVAENTRRRCLREEAMEKCPRTCNICKTSVPTSSFYPTTSVAPSTSPTKKKSLNPSAKPTHSIAPSLSSSPTQVASQHPTNNPSFAPTSLPSKTVSNSPSVSPTFSPSTSQSPSLSPTSFPTTFPSWHDSYNPSSLSQNPTIFKSSFPSTVPSKYDSNTPSSQSQMPSMTSHSPSRIPTHSTNTQATKLPSSHETYYGDRPTAGPSNSPSSETKTVVQGSSKDHGLHGQVVESRNMYTFVGVIVVGCVFVSLLILLFMKQRYDKKHTDSLSSRSIQSHEPFVSRFVHKSESRKKMELASTETDSIKLKTNSELTQEESAEEIDKGARQISQMADNGRKSNPVLQTSIDGVSLSLGSFNASVLSTTDEEDAYQKSNHGGKNDSRYQVSTYTGFIERFGSFCALASS